MCMWKGEVCKELAKIYMAEKQATHATVISPQCLGHMGKFGNMKKLWDSQSSTDLGSNASSPLNISELLNFKAWELSALKMEYHLSNNAFIRAKCYNTGAGIQYTVGAQ